MADLLLLVDFDGTVYRGEAPVRFYARRVAEALPAREAAAMLDSFERYLVEGVLAADGREDMVEAAALRESYDAWGAARHLAQRVYGVAPQVSTEAFMASRMYMLEQDCPLEPVGALLDALRSLRGRVRRVLATNSPAEGLGQVLDRLGVTEHFDGVASGLGKPDGLRRYLRAELGDGGLRANAWRLFSVGGHYRNEIEPAMEIGAAAGYVDRYNREDGAATATAPIVEGVLPALLSWADEAGETAAAVDADRMYSETWNVARTLTQ
ncbi:MAG: HAD family hydrolase [Actinocrinis sp.]